MEGSLWFEAACSHWGNNKPKTEGRILYSFYNIQVLAHVRGWHEILVIPKCSHFFCIYNFNDLYLYLMMFCFVFLHLSSLLSSTRSLVSPLSTGHQPTFPHLSSFQSQRAPQAITQAQALQNMVLTVRGFTWSLICATHLVTSTILTLGKLNQLERKTIMKIDGTLCNETQGQVATKFK